MTIRKSGIGYAATNQFSEVLLHYIEGKEYLCPFYKYNPNIAAFLQAIEDKSKEKINRNLLVDVLNTQHKRLENGTEEQQQNIDSLASEKTFTVCTGHQLCLFTGPLYFIYKIITTINLAEELKTKYSAYHFVPVYWMASEDHDFEEINHLYVFGKRIEWEKEEAPGNRKMPVGKLQTASLKRLIGELKTILGESENAKQIIILLTKAYLEHEDFADAMRYLLNTLFGNYGLVIIDGNDKRLKQELKEIIKDDILNNSNYHIVKTTEQALDQQHIKPQLYPRAINCFYMQDEMRERIEAVKNLSAKGEENSYKVLNTDISFSEAELLTEIENHPEYFSPNVILRPLYQEKILPNIAYIGGPSELTYWLELKAMFEHHYINFPVLMLRNSVLWIDSATNKKLEKLAIDAKQLFTDVNELIKETVSKKSGNEFIIEEEEEQLKKLYSGIALKVEKIDPTLKPAIEAELQKQLHALKNIQNKLLKAEKQKQETVVNQIKKIKEKFFPDGKPQERHDNFIPLYLKHGKDFIPLLKKNLNPFENKFIILSEIEH